MSARRKPRKRFPAKRFIHVPTARERLLNRAPADGATVDELVKARQTLGEVRPILQSAADRRNITGDIDDRSNEQGKVDFSWWIDVPHLRSAGIEKLLGIVEVYYLPPGRRGWPRGEEAHGVSKRGWFFVVGFRAIRYGGSAMTVPPSART